MNGYTLLNNVMVRPPWHISFFGTILILEIKMTFHNFLWQLIFNKEVEGWQLLAFRNINPLENAVLDQYIREHGSAGIEF